MASKVYSDYKESGSLWLGQIPGHWSVKKLKFLSVVQPSNVDKKTIDGEEPVLLCNYTDVYKNEYIDSRLEFMSATATSIEIKKFATDIGDVIVTKDSEDPYDIAIPACISEKIDGLLCGYHLTQIKPIDLDGRYLLRLFQSKGFNAQFIISANGVTRYGLPQYAISNAYCCMPPISEQIGIARFLDFKTGQIDALIRKQKALLDKLAEKRIALISHAVTKGLESSVLMKEIDLKWVDSIPVTWKKMILSRIILKCEQGWSPSCDDRLASENEWAVLKAGCVNYGIFNEAEHKTLPANIDPVFSLEVKTGDVLMCRASGSRHLIGSVARVKKCRPKIIFSDKTYRISFEHKMVEPDFFVFMMSSKYVREQIELSISGADGLANNIPQSSVKSYKIVLPPLNEQKKIVQFLEREIMRIEVQERKIKQLINKLKEYRSTLISNVVTGKIDVRDFKVPKLVEEGINS